MRVERECRRTIYGHKTASSAMRFPGSYLFVVALVLALSLAGCRRRTGEDMRPPQSAADVDRDVNRLGQRITLPVHPLEVWFQERPVGKPGGIGPTDYRLTAILRFEPRDIARLIGSAPAPTESHAVVGHEIDQPWAPAEVRAALAPRDEDSRQVRDGREIDATPFLRAPFSTGYAVSVGATGFVLLSLQTM
jgi:hypothetical protein